MHTGLSADLRCTFKKASLVFAFVGPIGNANMLQANMPFCRGLDCRFKLASN